VVPPPRDPAVRAKVDALVKRKNEVQALYDAGQYKTALPRAESLLKDASAVDYAPIQGHANFQLGQLHASLGQMKEAAKEAETAALAFQRGRDDEWAANAWALLGWVVGYREEKPDEGLRWMALARAEMDRRGTSSDEAEQRMASRRSMVLGGAGRYDQARADAETALRLARKLDPAGSPRVARSLNNLAIVLSFSGQDSEALPLSKESLTMIEKEYGELHPTSLQTRTNFMDTLNDNRRFAEALAVEDESIARWTKAFGPESRQVAGAITERARTLHGLGRYRESASEAQRALEIRAKLKARGESMPDDDAYMEMALIDLGRDLRMLGHPADAVPHLERALALDEAHGFSGPSSALVRFELAQALYETGARPRARTLAEAARAFWAEKGKKFGGGDALRRAEEARDWLAKHP
jgi:tetratricopeptide (TPR) repeat protein